MIESVAITIQQPGQPDRVVRVHEGVVRLGRAEDNDVVLSDLGVSRRHARVVVAVDAVRIEDLGSGNGTYHLGQPIESHTLEDGDEIVIDPFLLHFQIQLEDDCTGEETYPGESMVARLDVLAGNGLHRSTFPVGLRGLTLGRSEARDVVIPDPSASRHHCSILVREGAWLVKDMGSANGTYLNGTRVRETLLAEGDRIRIGNTEFRFSSANAPHLDSSTVGSAVSLEDDELSDVRLPVPDTATPVVSPRRRASGGGSMKGWLLGIAALGAGMLVLGTAVVVAVVVFWLPLQQGPGFVAEAPRWSLEADVPADMSASELEESGKDALREGRNDDALAYFHGVLLAEPGRPSAERLAFAAGEYVVVDTLGEGLATAVEERREAEQERERLLQDLNRGGRRARVAREKLEEAHLDAPEVQEALDISASPGSLEAHDKIRRAATKLNEERWGEAIDLYQAAFERTSDPSWRLTVRNHLRNAEREIAAAVADDWRAGVLAEANGDVDAARQHYEQVLSAHPGHVSARLRLEELNAR